jgi:hypothetical protein
MFAAVMLVIIGVFSFVQGLAALLDDDFFSAVEVYAYDINTTAWGWTHLITGLIVGVAGFYVFSGALWARIIGVVVAGISAIVNFMWIPYYPLWAVLIIAIDVLVIWALTANYNETSNS